MTTTNNAASTAVRAAACLNTIQNEASGRLPSAEQTMHLGLFMVAEALRCAIDAALEIADEDPCVDSVNTAELALQTVKRLSVVQDDFDQQWFLVYSAARLAADSFPDKDTPAWRHLNAAVQSSSVFLEAWQLMGSPAAIERAGVPA